MCQTTQAMFYCTKDPCLKSHQNYSMYQTRFATYFTASFTPLENKYIWHQLNLAAQFTILLYTNSPTLWQHVRCCRDSCLNNIHQHQYNVIVQSKQQPNRKNYSVPVWQIVLWTRNTFCRSRSLSNATFSFFDHMTLIQFKMCCCVQNFIEIG